MLKPPCLFQRSLNRRFRIAGRTSVVLIDSRSGRVISRPSLETISGDSEGRLFPWRTRSLKELLSRVELVDTSGMEVNYEDIRPGFKALYFAAQWVIG